MNSAAQNTCHEVQLLASELKLLEVWKGFNKDATRSSAQTHIFHFGKRFESLTQKCLRRGILLVPTRVPTNNWNKGCDPPPANSLQTGFDSWNTQQKDGNQSMCLIFSGPLPVTYYVHLHTITYFNLEISWRYVSQICPHCTPAFVASFSLQALLSSHQGSIQGRQLLHQMTRLKQLLWWG